MRRERWDGFEVKEVKTIEGPIPSYFRPTAKHPQGPSRAKGRMRFRVGPGRYTFPLSSRVFPLPVWFPPAALWESFPQGVRGCRSAGEGIPGQGLLHWTVPELASPGQRGFGRWIPWGSMNCHPAQWMLRRSVDPRPLRRAGARRVGRRVLPRVGRDQPNLHPAPWIPGWWWWSRGCASRAPAMPMPGGSSRRRNRP